MGTQLSLWVLLLAWQAQLVSLQSELVQMGTREGKITGQQGQKNITEEEQDLPVQQAVSSGQL